MISIAQAKILIIRAPQQVYNLINRCIMHNISYDDCKDQHFLTNYKFRSKVPVS